MVHSREHWTMPMNCQVNETTGKMADKGKPCFVFSCLTVCLYDVHNLVNHATASGWYYVSILLLLCLFYYCSALMKTLWACLMTLVLEHNNPWTIFKADKLKSTFHTGFTVSDASTEDKLGITPNLLPWYWLALADSLSIYTLLLQRAVICGNMIYLH